MASSNQRQESMYQPGGARGDDTLILEHSPPLEDGRADGSGGRDADKGISFAEADGLAVPVGSTTRPQAAGQSDPDWQPEFVDAKGKALTGATGQGTTADVIDGIGA